MWDFSWLERRWPGAGYEDWDKALDELVERGYDAVRIDAYPHLIAVDPDREWEIVPVWNQQVWGAPATVRVTVRKPLLEFLAKCAERNVKVGLSTWFRQDAGNVRMQIVTPEQHADAWRRTLDIIDAEGLLETILYVDLCNEWTHSWWAPIFHNPRPDGPGVWDSPASMAWMRRAIEVLRGHYPQMPMAFSFNTRHARLKEVELDFMDFLEPHIWFASGTVGDFYARVGYQYEPFEPRGYENLVRYGESTYRANPEHWLNILRSTINLAAEASRKWRRPLITTESWSVVDYKDWPGLDWGWVKEGCQVGVETALATGCWASLCTSNFCGPQFHGMWGDVAWHQRLTGLIHQSNLPD